jgi:UDP-N-acetylglucosamine--N-acetylmuramyl-(pentapeptide) pyrophosphoryl-undecaprenol N-acetylglucosamine transferase
LKLRLKEETAVQIMIAAGGTGGHVYPALAIAEALLKQTPDAELHFIGSVGGFERPLIAASGVPFVRIAEVQAGPLNGVGVTRALLSAGRIAIGLVQALALMLRQRPDALLLTGGWVCVPGAIAAWLLRVPSLIYLPDIEPALTIKALRHLATRVAVTAPESLRYFRTGQAVVTGYPLRPALLAATREAGIAHFGLDAARRTLLVTGGSRGARTINRAVTAILPALLAEGVQVLHITGTLDWEEVRAGAGAHGLHVPEAGGADAAGRGYHACPYLHDEMALALAAADLVVCRAGASTLGELPLFGLPAILVPYPYAWRYQKVNADYLVSRGAALMLEDERMENDLLHTVQKVLSDAALRGKMIDAARSISQPEGAANAAQVLIRIAKGIQ